MVARPLPGKGPSIAESKGGVQIDDDHFRTHAIEKQELT